MIRQIHRLLTSSRLTRSAQRKLVVSLKSTLGCPDAYRDIAALIDRTQPAAILDIGSHHGKTIARLLESHKVPIHGFEPTAASFARLSDRFTNHELVRLHKLALSDRNGTTELHCNSNEQTNSLLDNDIGNQRSLSGATQHVATETIETIRLDDWMQQNLPTGNIVIKSDVQGAEGLLLSGGMETFRDRVIGFYSEAQIAPMYEGQTDLCELHSRLTGQMGFVLHNIYPCYHDAQGRALQTDALWIKEAYLVPNK